MDVSIRGFKWMVWSCFTIIVKFKIIITLSSLLSYLETPVNARLLTSHFLNRQVRKSRIPRPNWDESRFPESSLIPFPVKIFSVFLNPAPCFGQFPDPENTLPDPKLSWDYPSFLTCGCGPFNGVMTHADVLDVRRSPKKRGVNRWTHRRILKIFCSHFGFKARSGFIQKNATIFQGLFKDFSRTTLDFQGPPARNIISQIVQKCTFPVYSNKALRLELFACLKLIVNYCIKHRALYVNNLIIILWAMIDILS